MMTVKIMVDQKIIAEKTTRLIKFVLFITFTLLIIYSGLASSALADTILVPNPDFEIGTIVPLNWTLVTRNDNTPIWDSAVSHSGSKSIKISNPTIKISGYPKSDLVEVEPLQNYTFSVWGKTQNILKNAQSVIIIELDINKKWLIQRNLNFNKGTNLWTQKQIEFQTGSSAAYVYIYANIWNSTGTFWVDDIKLTSNLIKNQGFERGATVPLNWTFVTNNGNTPIWDSAVSHTGSRSIKISNPTSIISGYPKSDLIKVEPTQNYTFSAWGKTQNILNNTHAVRIVELDINKKWLTQRNLDFNKGTNGWTQKKIDFRAGSNTAYIYVYANIYNSTGTFWIDDIILTLNPISNLLTNPDFEIGTTVLLNWTLVTRNSNTPIWDSTVSHTGSRSIKISNPTSNISGYPKSDLIKVKPLQNYTFSAWGKTQNILNNTHAVRIVELDINKKWLTQRNLNFNKGTNDWTQKKIDFRTGSNTAYIYVYANIWGGQGIFWVDDMNLTLKPPQLLFVGDFETGDNNQWDYICEYQSGRFQIVTYPVRQGKYAAKFTVKSGDACNTANERLELAELFPDAIEEVEGSDYFYAWSTLFPSNWTPVSQWGVINQWNTPYLQGPRATLAIFTSSNDRIIMGICGGNIDNGTCKYDKEIEVIENLTKGKWNDFIVHIKWSAYGKGQIEMWHRLEGETTFKKVLALQNVSNLQWRTGEPVAHISHKQLGLYRSHTEATQTLYQDGYRIGTTFESVLYS